MVYTYFTGLILLNTNNREIFVKLNFNDSFLNTYNYFWLNFVFIFFFFLSLAILFFYKNLSFSVATWITWIFLGYGYELLNNVITLNQTYEFLNVYWNDGNLLLLNNLNKYHPFLFYINLILFVSLFVHSCIIKKIPNNLHHLTFFLIKKKSLNLISVLVGASVLILGAWWAFQEATWGGWWNWDPSEVFGLSFVIVFFFFLHLKWQPAAVILWNWNLSFYLMWIAAWYYFIQLNFDLTSHNFGLRFFFFFNNNFWYFELFFFYACILFMRVRVASNYFLNFVFLRDLIIKQRIWFFECLFLQTIVILYFISSNALILNFFLWTLFTFKFFFIKNWVGSLNWSLVLMWNVIIFWKLSKHYYYVLGICIALSNTNFLYSHCVGFHYTFLNVLHYVLYTFFVSSLVEINLTTSCKTTITHLYAEQFKSFFMNELLNFNLIETCHMRFENKIFCYNWNFKYPISIFSYCTNASSFCLQTLFFNQNFVSLSSLQYLNVIQKLYLMVTFFVAVLIYKKNKRKRGHLYL